MATYTHINSLKHTYMNKLVLNITLIFVPIGTNKPTLKSLMKYRNSIAPIWHNLGIQLLPVKHTAKLGVIQADNHNKVEDCCDKMFQHWFTVDTEANWNKLIDALESIDQNATAATIREDISRGKFY